MRYPLSFAALLLVLLVAAAIRVYYYQEQERRQPPFSHITYDAFGYYLYLPGGLLYGDLTSADWIEPMHQTYRVKGGDWLYQTIRQPDGRHVGKYLGGVALLQLPFFTLAHVMAGWIGYPQDGFSLPYQWAVMVAAFFYAFLGLWLMRRFMLAYFDDRTTALTLLLTGLATNWVQYVAVDGAQSHIYIFSLYALLLWWTKCWHERPSPGLAFGIGADIGLATICRPTEAIMLFIPLLWGTQDAASRREKWALVRAHRTHVAWAVLGGVLGVLPQLIYWKYATGHFIFDVGSKWYFLSPWLRVLFGFEKGWFVYTPVTVFFVLGFAFLKGLPFQRSVWVFCGLNLWIITAWADWRYGGSYSTRALVQSYPVFALGLAAFLQWVLSTRWRPVVLVVSAYLILVNLFQVYQYNAGILRYDENSFEYYRSIYLNPHAQPDVPPAGGR